MEKSKIQKGKKSIMIILFSVLGVFVIFFISVALLNLYYITPTKGEPVAKYKNPKSALLVIDMQNDITNSSLYKGTPEFVKSVNLAIEFANENGMEILYVKNEYTNPIVILLSGGRGKKGTEGVEFDSRLNVVNKNIFTKALGDSFSVASFEEYLVSNEVDTLYLIGADAAGCVLRTAQGGRNRNYSVTIVRDVVITAVNDTKMKQVEEQYKKDGIKTIALNEFYQ